MLDTVLDNGTYVATLNGTDKFTVVIADDIKKEISEVVEKGSDVKINLENIKFIDSSGIGVLISGLKKARQKNINYTLINVQPDVKSLLSLMKLDKVFEIE